MGALVTHKTSPFLPKGRERFVNHMRIIHMRIHLQVRIDTIQDGQGHGYAVVVVALEACIGRKGWKLGLPSFVGAFSADQ